MQLIGQRVPNQRETEDETLDGTFARDGVDPGQYFGLASRAVDLDGAAFGVDQPADLRAAQEPLPHLFAQGADTIRLGSQLDDEVRTQVPVGFEVFLAELADSLLEDPGGIGRAASPTRKNVTGGRVVGDPALVQLCPTAQLPIDFGVLRAGEGVVGRRYDEGPFGGHFEGEVGVLGAEFGKLLVGHRRDGKLGREEGCVDQERHVGILSRLAWGQNDGITVVSVRRVE